MKVSGIMIIKNEEMYLRQAIMSVLPLVNELIIVNNNSQDTSKRIINELQKKYKQIKLIQVFNNESKYRCMQFALQSCIYSWILRCDGDMIFDKQDQLLKMINGKKKNRFRYDGLFMYAYNIYGDISHVKLVNPYKTENLFLIKKNRLMVSHDPLTEDIIIYSYKEGNYLYITSSDKDPCFIWHMSYCKPPEQLLYQNMKNSYLRNGKNKSFDKYIESLNQDYKGAIRWLEKNIVNEYYKLSDSLIPPILPWFTIKEFTPYQSTTKYSYYDIDTCHQICRKISIKTRRLKYPRMNRDYVITLTILVRNTEQYLKECLESVFNQTSDRWKVIIVNDFSDNGPTNIDDYLAPSFHHLKSKIKVINLDQWYGIARAHAVAVANVDTGIVGVLDSDDKLELNAIEEILKIYNDTREEIFVYSNYWICDKNLNKIEFGYSYQPSIDIINERCASHFRTFMLKTYYKIHGYDSDLILGAVDQDLFFQLETVAKPYYLHKYLYYYRFYNMTGTITNMSMGNTFMLSVSLLKNIIRKHNSIDFNLKIFTNSDLTTYRKCVSYILNGNSSIIINDKQYYFELHCHNTYLATLNYNDNREIFNVYLANKMDAYIPINVEWQNGWKIVDKIITDFKKITINRYFNCVYVLNLKKDTQKRARMEIILNNLGITYVIFDAVYGKMHMDEFNKINREATGSNYVSPGAYGYTMTMINILKDAKEKKYKKILTLDDDVIFHNDFVNKFDEYVRQVPHDWYLLFLGLSGPWSHPWVNNDFKNFNFDKTYIQDLFNCDGSYAVGYDHRMFDEIIQVAEKFWDPFDTAIIRHFRTNYLKKCYSFYPYLAIADTTTSDISERAEDVEENYLHYQFKYRINLNDYDLKSLDHNKYQTLQRLIK